MDQAPYICSGILISEVMLGSMLLCCVLHNSKVIFGFKTEIINYNRVFWSRLTLAKIKLAHVNMSTCYSFRLGQWRLCVLAREVTLTAEVQINVHV